MVTLIRMVRTSARVVNSLIAPDVRRIGDDRHPAKAVDRQRILAAAYVTAIDAAQAEGFQMPDQRAVTSARLGKGSDALARRYGISGSTAARGVG